MGYFLNPSNDFFSEMVSSGMYTDKTQIISFLNKIINTQCKFICMSRPRRFGKTSIVNMLVAYYSKGCDSLSLFRGLKAEKSDTFSMYLNKCNVFIFNIKKFYLKYSNVKNIIKSINKSIIDDLKSEFSYDSDYVDLPSVLTDIYRKTGNKFIFIIDEWDCLLREEKYKKEEIRKYLNFLEDIFKDRVYVSLIYMTGILPIKKYGTHSALNMFQEVSMISASEYDEFAGFTHEEVEKIYNMDKNKIEQAKQWYDGYNIGDASHIYNPQSVMFSKMIGKYNNYWTQTESYEALSDYISKDFDGLKGDIIRMFFAGESVQIDPFRFQNDMTSLKTKDDVLTLLVHLGYLTFNYKNNTVSIPNREVKSSFYSSISGDNWENVYTPLRQSEDLLRATLDKNQSKVSEMLLSCHENLSSHLTYSHESDIVCSIIVAYYYAKKDYMIFREFLSGRGFADIVFMPINNIANRPPFIVEVKYNKDAKSAISQIKNKHYTNRFENYFGEIILVGVNYTKNNKYECIIESVYKK